MASNRGSHVVQMKNCSKNTPPPETARLLNYLPSTHHRLDANKYLYLAATVSSDSVF